MTRTGRPLLPAGEARGKMFSVRLSPEERELIDAAALRKKQKVTSWARKCLIDRAKRDIA